MALLPRLRRTLVYKAWRLYRSREQLARFEGLLDRTRCTAARFGERDLRAALERRAPSRKTLSGAIGISAFGTCDWEDKGLWQAMGRAGDFSLFDHRKATIPPDATPRQRREALGRAFLAEIGRREREDREVHVAFIYASGSDVDPSALAELQRRRIWTVLLALDDKQQMTPARIGDLGDWQLDAARGVDVYWTTWRGGVDWLADQGVNPWYAAEAADADIFAPAEVARDIPVLWLGQGYGIRFELIRYLRARGFNVQVYGPGWPAGPVPFEKMVRLYSRAEVVLGMGAMLQTEDLKHLKGRDFEVPMAGALYLTSFNPELCDHYAVGEEILCYSSFLDCAEVLGWILRRPEKAAAIRQAARRRAVAAHTWDRRIDDLLALMRGV